jgi:hypothetical protein
MMTYMDIHALHREISDVPFSCAYEKSENPDPERDHFLAEVHLLDEFELYVAAQTLDSRTGASSVFTALAAANWTLNRHGTVDSSYVWKAATDAKNTVDPKTWCPTGEKRLAYDPNALLANAAGTTAEWK